MAALEFIGPCTIPMPSPVVTRRASHGATPRAVNSVGEVQGAWQVGQGKEEGDVGMATMSKNRPV